MRGRHLRALANQCVQRLLLWFSAGLPIYASEPAFADVTSQRLLNNVWGVAIEGEITKSSADAVEAFFAAHSNTVVLVFLNSVGGDAVAGLYIGYLIRENEARTFIPEGMTCASACALTYLGGVSRVLFGRLGLHRPYQAEGRVGSGEYKTLLQLVREYLEEMNISARVFDVIRTTPPREMAWFSPEQTDLTVLRELGLHGDDPIWIEEIESLSAAGYGISKSEFFQRETIAEEGCEAESLQEWSDCYSHVMATGSLPETGIPPPIVPTDEPVLQLPDPGSGAVADLPPSQPEALPEQAPVPRAPQPQPGAPEVEPTVPRSDDCVWNAREYQYECWQSEAPQVEAAAPRSDRCVWNAKVHHYECW